MSGSRRATWTTLAAVRSSCPCAAPASLRRHSQRAVACAQSIVTVSHRRGHRAREEASADITEEDIERAQRRHRMPTEQDLGRVPVPAAPKVDALPGRRAAPAIDLEALAKGIRASTNRIASRARPGLRPGSAHLRQLLDAGGDARTPGRSGRAVRGDPGDPRAR